MVCARSVLVSLIVKVDPASGHQPRNASVAAAVRNSVCRLGALRRTGTGDLSVRFRPAVAIELPSIADFLNFIEIEFRDQQFIFVAAGLLHDFPARVAEIALAVEFADLPGVLGADAVVGRDKMGIGEGAGRLFEFPKIFREGSDSGRRVVDDSRAVESEDSRAFREVPVVADVHADAEIVYNPSATVAGLSEYLWE